jgi:hypothetical protein
MNFDRICRVLSVPAGDEMLSDSFPYKELENGLLWEVDGKVFWFAPTAARFGCCMSVI